METTVILLERSTAFNASFERLIVTPISFIFSE